VGVFERYTEQSKRAVFFARQAALRGGATAIDANHLLLGLLSERNTRADILFRLHELVPDEAAEQAKVREDKTIERNIPLATECKRTIAYPEQEANQLTDYWIDTEHLVLGILREEQSLASKRLRALGLDLGICRGAVAANPGSKSEKREPVLWWVRRRPVGFATFAMFLFALGIAVALILLGYVVWGIAFALIVGFRGVRAVFRGEAI